MPKRGITVDLSEETAKRLEGLSEEDGKTISEFVAGIVDGIDASRHNPDGNHKMPCPRENCYIRREVSIETTGALAHLGEH